MSLTTLSNYRTSFFVKIIDKTKKKKEFAREDLSLFRLVESIDLLRLSLIASNANLESTKENLLDFLNNFLLIAIRRYFEAIKQIAS